MATLSTPDCTTLQAEGFSILQIFQHTMVIHHNELVGAIRERGCMRDLGRWHS